MDASDYTTTTYELEMLCGLLLKAARQELTQRLERAGVNLRPGQYLILRALNKRTSTLAELSRSLVLDPSSLLPSVDQLEQRGAIKRLSDPTDRRRTPLMVTDEGKALLSRVPPLTEESPLRQSLQNLGPEKCRQLIGLLAQVVFPFIDEQALLYTSAALRTLIEEQAGEGIK
jgi:DNA-binding MarR family transcriptional regulator